VGAVSNNTLRWTADGPQLRCGCRYQAEAQVGNYAISPDVTFGSLVRYRLSYMPTGTVIGGISVLAIRLHPKPAPIGWRGKPIRPQTIFYH